MLDAGLGGCRWDYPGQSVVGPPTRLPVFRTRTMMPEDCWMGALETNFLGWFSLSECSYMKPPPTCRADVCFRQEDLDPDMVSERYVVLVDVLRAASTAVTAFASGATEIRCFATVRGAVRAAGRLGRDLVILCGERGGRRLPGFDVGNSPAEMTPEHVGGRVLVMTTTNCTRALVRLRGARAVLLGAFLNRSAVAKYLDGRAGDVLLVCAGTHGVRSDDDVACAGAIAELLERGGCELSLAAQESVRVWHRMRRAPVKFLLRTEGARPLLACGLEADIPRCARRDRFGLVPRMVDARESWRFRPVAVPSG